MSYTRRISGLGLSYDDVCILQQRMRQGYSGLDDNASAAYASDHARWVTEKAAYDKALSAWSSAYTQLSLAHARATLAYQADLAKWKTETAAYQSALRSYDDQARMTAMTSAISQNSILAKYPSIVLPPDYPGCVTQAQHAAWDKTCTALTSIRGLSGAPTGPECGLALLPVCQPPKAVPTPPRASPKPPAPPSYPLKPPALRPEPQAPAPTPVQTAIPTYTPPPIPSPSVPKTPAQIPTYTPIPATPGPASTVPAASTKSGGLLSNGLLLVVLAGGGYALYRTLRKPKAA